MLYLLIHAYTVPTVGTCYHPFIGIVMPEKKGGGESGTNQSTYMTSQAIANILG
jgi:hypothetical protein